jgi:hypothetical protein
MTIKSIKFVECDHCHRLINPGDTIAILVTGVYNGIGEPMPLREDRDFHANCFSEYQYKNTVNPSKKSVHL